MFRYLYILIFSLILIGCKEPPAPEAQADFFVEGSECTAPCNVKFWNNSVNDVEWKWDFGNGITSFKENDTITYTYDGTFTVKLTVWNVDNVPDSVQKTVTIH